MSSPNYVPMFQWIIERERVRIRREMGQPKPWTADPILLDNRFCNVRREDDTVTVWIRKNLREKFHDHPYLWWFLCVGRMINHPDTLQELLQKLAGVDVMEMPARMAQVMRERQARGEKLYTGAYMIPAPHVKGEDKQKYICEKVCGSLLLMRTEVEPFLKHKPTLQGMHRRITRFNGWGPFLAYQAVVDMRFTHLLMNASDVASWAAAGPGTIRGLNRIWGRKLEFALPQERALSEMRAIYPLVERETGVKVDFSDVPNILCETDKYLRVMRGEGKTRQSYPGRG